MIYIDTEFKTASQKADKLQKYTKDKEAILI